jgi:hypothetical protein
MSRKKPSKVLQSRSAGPNHAVVSYEGKGDHMHRPCEQCPWRKDVPTGTFPAEAFRISAPTSYDAATRMFACHMSGADGRMPATCAGFLLANSVNNIGVRMKMAMGTLDMSKVSADMELYESYRAMAEANGVDPDDPALKPCRGNFE